VVVVLIPSLLAREAGGQGRFELEAATAREALLVLPVRDLLFDERGDLRPLVNVYVNRTQVDALDDELQADDEIRLVAAVAGGEGAG
jgi:molybdopterin converting factor small subunit